MSMPVARVTEIESYHASLPCGSPRGVHQVFGLLNQRENICD